MPRTKRVEIANEKLCKSVQKRRVDNLYKKAYELSMLCESQVYLVVHDNKEGMLTLWPSEDMFYQGLVRYMDLPEHERSKKIALNLDFLEGMVNAMNEKLMKQQKRNEEDEIEEIMSQLMQKMNVNEIDMSQFDRLNSHIDEKIVKLQERMGDYEKNKEGVVEQEVKHSRAPKRLRNSVQGRSSFPK